LLCENEELQILGLAAYIKSTKPTLLTESEPFYMAYATNKDVSLRSLIKEDKFTKLINKTVDLSGD